MISNRKCFYRCGVPSFVVGVLLAVGPGQADAQGTYGAVTDKEIMAMKLNHYFSADKKSHKADFEWTFTEKGFTIKAGKEKLPAELVEKLLPDGVTADEIRGKWKIDSKDGQQLVLSSIKAKDKPGKKQVSLVLYKTAPTVVRVGEPQYVFGIGP
jgi:hypothetical protein